MLQKLFRLLSVKQSASVPGAQAVHLCITADGLLFAFLILLTTLGSCSSNPPLQTAGESYLQGEWKQDSVPAQSKLLSYSLYRFRFTCDSFYMQQQSFSKVNSGYDTCMNRGRWAEYMKGNYGQRHDTLQLKGFFCNAQYKLKDAGGCFRSGVYEENFIVHQTADSLLQFISTSGVVPVSLHLTKHITCHPKPI